MMTSRILRCLSLVSLMTLASATAEARALSPFTLPQMNPAIASNTFSTDAFDDAVYVIETFQLRCGYCNTNAPNVGSLAGFYSYDDQVKFVDLGIDRSDRDYAQWISRHSVQHYVLKDASRTVFGELGATGTPTSYILDSNLNIVWEHVGVWSTLDVEEMKDVIDGLLD